MGRPPLEIASLTPAERLDLIEQLWDSLSPAEDVPVTEAQREELRRRIVALERGETSTIPLEQVLTAIRGGRAAG